MTDNRIIEGKDKDDNPVKVMLKVPAAQEYRDSQMEYNKAFRKALDSGALLRQKLSDYMREQGIWNEAKQKENDAFVQKIQEKEALLKKGGIRLSDAREIALELRVLRAEFREFLAEKNTMDQNSAEGQADNARFAELTRLCMLNPSTKEPYFQTQADFDGAADQPWVIEGSSELASMIYGLDPNYDNKLEENKFLREFKFSNDENRLINENGHLVDGKGKLLTEDGRYVQYRTKKAELAQDEKNRYYVNRDGEEVVEIVDEDGNTTWEKPENMERQPFLDDQDKPVVVEAEAEEGEVKEKAEATEEKKPKTRRKTTKVETDTEAS
jgi:hypothetical protein